jgi:hypothetical protein
LRWKRKRTIQPPKGTEKATAQPVEKGWFNAVGLAVYRRVHPVAIQHHLAINLHIFVFVGGPDVTIAEFVKKKWVTHQHKQQENPFSIAQAKAVGYIYNSLILTQK